METSSAKPSVGPFPKRLPFLPNLIHRLSTHVATQLDETKRLAAAALPSFLPKPPSLPFASVSQRQENQTSYASETSLNSEYVAGRLVGTSVYTVSNTNNEFVLISDPYGVKSIGLLCFRKEDAETFLAQVRSRRGELKGGAKVVPISLDQVYMLKVEGIAFRFLPDPVQIKHALELKASDTGFDGVPVFQFDLLAKLFGVPQPMDKAINDIVNLYPDGNGKKKNDTGKETGLWSMFIKSSTCHPTSWSTCRPDVHERLGPTWRRYNHAVEISDLLVVKKKNKRYCPIYFQKEDIEKALSTVSRVSRGPGVNQHIMVGSLEDVLKKMEISGKNSGWEDLIFIPPGKLHSRHIQEVPNV
ncbi:hypothetical protein OROGR_000859 [Orobanche gracilis]